MIIAGSSLKLIVQIDEDIGVGASVLIKFVNPSNSGSWVATIEDALIGRVSYQAQPADLTVEGKWSYWAVYTLGDGTVWKTSAGQFTVYAEGTAQR